MESRAVKLLSLYGLSERESAVYLHLLRGGPASAGEIAKLLRVSRMEAYRIAKVLTDNNVVASEAGTPVKYAARAIDEVLAEKMVQQMKILKDLEDARKELVGLGRVLTTGRANEPQDNQRFRVIQGREKIYNLMTRMVSSAKSSIDILLTRNDLVQAYATGMTDALVEASMRGARCRGVAFVDESAIDAANAMGGACEFRHSDQANLARLAVVDGTETLSSLVLDDSSGRRNERDVAIWFGGKNYAQLMGYLYDQAYAAAVPGEQRLKFLAQIKRFDGAKRSVVDVARATMPLEGWEVVTPGSLKGETGTEYAFDIVLRNREKAIGADVVIGSDERDARERVISCLMKSNDVKGARLAVITRPRASEEVAKLANLLGVAVIDCTDTVEAVAELRKFAKGKA